MLRNAGKLINTHPKLGAFAIWAAVKVDYDLLVVDGYRSNDVQTQLYAEGRDADGNVTGTVVTNAKAGQSAHNYGLAIDMGPYAPERSDQLATADDPRYAELGDMAKQFGLTWGGDFTLASGNSDPDHFEITDWRNNESWRTQIATVGLVALVLVVIVGVL